MGWSNGFQRVFWILPLVLMTLVGCGPSYQENLYGEGFLPSQNSAFGPTGEPIDYDAYQVNFVAVSVRQVSYRMTETISQMVVRGTCYNPGFEVNSLYYRVFDSEGYHIAADGYPYSTNIVYDSVTQKLRPITLMCKTNGTWETTIDIPTATLQQVTGGTLEVSMVVWLKGKDLHNSTTGVSSVSITPPAPEPSTLNQ